MAARSNLLPRLTELRIAPRKDYPMGRLALVLAALLHAGVAPDDPEVKAALEKLDGLPIRRTYSAACYLFALDAFWRRAFQEDDLLGPAPLPRQAQGSARDKMHALVEWLVAARWKREGTWTYGKATRPGRQDLSNTQFATLGLLVGLQHGVKMPLEVLHDLLEHLPEAQQVEPSVRRVAIQPAPSTATALGFGAAPRRRSFTGKPGGWTYRTNSRQGRGNRPNQGNRRGPFASLDAPYPSMTAATASSIAVALQGVTGRRGFELLTLDHRSTRRACEALLMASAWVTEHFDAFLVDDRNLFYRLYSLEKFADLCGIESFGIHNWYKRGAACVLERQSPDGSFGSYIDTSFALLFLTRSTRSLKVLAAPTLYTRRASGAAATQSTRGSSKRGSSERAKAGVGGAAQPSDLVYIAAVRGFLSAKAVLRYVGEARRAKLVALGEEVVERFKPAARKDLVPVLLSIWTKPDAITRFARRSLEAITGLKSKNKTAYRAWLEQPRSQATPSPVD